MNPSKKAIVRVISRLAGDVVALGRLRNGLAVLGVAATPMEVDPLASIFDLMCVPEDSPGEYGDMRYNLTRDSLGIECGDDLIDNIEAAMRHEGLLP